MDDVANLVLFEIGEELLFEELEEVFKKDGIVVSCSKMAVVQNSNLQGSLHDIFKCLATGLLFSTLLGLLGFSFLRLLVKTLGEVLEVIITKGDKVSVWILTLDIFTDILDFFKYLVAKLSTAVVLLHTLHLDVELLLLLANTTKERIVNDLCEKGKWVARLLLIKVGRVHDTVLNTVRYHFLFEDVVGEVRLLGEIVSNVEKALAYVVRHTRRLCTLSLGFSDSLFVFDEFVQKLLVVDIVIL
jgi:hypothetical protein